MCPFRLPDNVLSVTGRFHMTSWQPDIGAYIKTIKCSLTLKLISYVNTLVRSNKFKPRR